MYIIKDKNTNTYVCRDGKRRDWLIEGNVGCCVKEYKSIVYAKKKAQSIGLDNFELINHYK